MFGPVRETFGKRYTGLENRQGCKPLVGSNPTPSAKRPKLFAPLLEANTAASKNL